MVSLLIHVSNVPVLKPRSLLIRNIVYLQLIVLETHEKEKKKQYWQACADQCRDFTPFVVSTDGLLGREAAEVLRQLSGILATKWGSPYSHVCGFVKARMSIAIARATNRCLRGSRVPSKQISHSSPHWEDGAGLCLFTLT